MDILLLPSILFEAPAIDRKKSSTIDRKIIDLQLIYTTRDGFKYTQVKSLHEVIYLRCVLRQNSNRCRGTAKLNKISNLIESKHAHNHAISLYDSRLYELKAKCKTAAKTSREKLIKVFKDTCRNDQASTLVSYKNLESAMYRSRREVEPTIPRCATEFCQEIQLTQYGMYYRGEVIVGADIGVIFYSDKIAQFLQKLMKFYLMGPFILCPFNFTNFGQFLAE